MELKNLYGYVSQVGWKDTDNEVECAVEAMIDGVKKKAVFMCIDPMTAIEMCRKNPQNFSWNDK